MLVVMRENISSDDIRRVVEAIQGMGYEVRSIPGGERTSMGLTGDDRSADPGRLRDLPGVLEVLPADRTHLQVSRERQKDDTVIVLPNGTRIGGRNVVLMAGPCAVESQEQILTIARDLAEAGVTVLRGGAFKPRTSPYSFQGLGKPALEMLARAKGETGMAVVTEVLDADTAEEAAAYVDILQVGARNMQNYPLLRTVGLIGKPVLLKRAFSATIEELLLAAEYVLAEGNSQVVLCERGIRSFDAQARNLLDLTAIPLVKSLSHLPIIADPSHGTGARARVIPMARAAVAAGADGLIVEVHPDPMRALSDGAQSLYPDQFREMVHQVRAIAQAIGRDLAPGV
jgi:3-deoxy-7-phosphoheptulonate synthase